METDNKQISGNIDEIIERHLFDRSTDEEAAYLLQWLDESEENREYYAQVAAIFSVHRALKSGEKRSEAMLIRLNERIDAEADNPVVRPRRKRRWYYVAIAAGIAIGVLFGNRFEKPQPVVPETQYYTYCNTSSEVQAIVLRDNSKIWLHGGSILECDITDSETRTVKLSGAAYFDVARDTLRPFIVKTKGIAVRVLGTKFSVETSMDEVKTTVVLESGSVRLQTLEGANLLRLLPDQKAVYNANTDDVIINAENASSYVTEYFNKVSIPNATLGEILGHVNAMYSTNLIPSCRFDCTKTYTLNYKRTDSLDTVINTIVTLTGVKLDNTTPIN